MCGWLFQIDIVLCYFLHAKLLSDGGEIRYSESDEKKNKQTLSVLDLYHQLLATAKMYPFLENEQPWQHW